MLKKCTHDVSMAKIDGNQYVRTCHLACEIRASIFRKVTCQMARVHMPNAVNLAMPTSRLHFFQLLFSFLFVYLYYCSKTNFNLFPFINETIIYVFLHSCKSSLSNVIITVVLNRRH